MDVKNLLMELFPELSEEQADALARTGDDISVLITRVLDNNVDPPTVDIKELYRGDISSAPILQCEKSRDGVHSAYYSSRLKSPAPQAGVAAKAARSEVAEHYNYPEAFEPNTPIDMHADVKALRRRAGEVMRSGRREEARSLNRAAALVLMRRVVELFRVGEEGVLDLHGLTVEEAGKFMDDHFRFSHGFRGCERIRVVTGQEFNSKRIRPAVKEWAAGKGLECEDEGAAVIIGCKYLMS